MDTIIKTLFAIGIVIAAILFKGFVFTKLWLWFLVPLFELPEINMAYALGIILIARLIKKPKNTLGNTTIDFSELLVSLLHPLIILVIGWVLKHYI